MANKKNKTALPSTPEWNLGVKIGDIGRGSSNFEIPLEVRVTRFGNVVSSTGVLFKEGTTDIATDTTDSSGIVNYIFKPPFTAAGKNVTLRVLLKDRVEEANFTISLPKDEKKIDHDPEHLDMIGLINNETGDAAISVRVTDERGYGIENRKVTFLFSLKKGKEPNGEVTTNPEGHGLFLMPFQLSEGEVVRVMADVSGIRKHCSIVLRRKEDPEQSGIDRFFDRIKYLRFLNSNNRRCAVALLISVILWIVCFYIGFGDPLISKPEVVSTNWERHFWFWTFVWTIASFVYVPIAFREEWTEAWRNIRNKFDDEATDSVGDPFMESAFDRLSSVGSTSKGKISRVESESATKGGGVSGRFGIGTLFGIDLLAEFVTELLPKMFVKVFKK